MPESGLLDKFDATYNKVAKERESGGLELNEVQLSRLRSVMSRVCDLRPYIINMFMELRAGNALAQELAAEMAEQFDIPVNDVFTPAKAAKSTKAPAPKTGLAAALKAVPAPVQAPPNPAPAPAAPSEPLAIAAANNTPPPAAPPAAAPAAAPEPAKKRGRPPAAVKAPADKPSDAVIAVLKELKALKKLNIDGRSARKLPALIDEAVKGKGAWSELKPKIVAALGTFTAASGGKPDPTATSFVPRLEG